MQNIESRLCRWVVLVAVTMLSVACAEKPRPQRPTPVVSVDTAKRGPLPYVVAANGEVEANRTVSVQSLVSGMLTRTAISEGQEVSQGQVLFQIDPRPFRAELDRVQSTLARDEATLARARSDSGRFAALAKDGYVTRQQLDQAFAETSALSATVAAGRASLEVAQLNLDNTTVRAPISGRTGQLAVKTGNLVRAQSDPPLVVINELRPVLVRFSVPEDDFEEMRQRSGMDRPLNVKVTPKVGDSTRSVVGKLTFINNVVDRASGSVLLKARVENEQKDLWPGQFVTIGLELNVDTAAVTVPTVAVVTTASGSFVYVVGDSMKVKRTPVTVGRQAGNVSTIERGLSGGEQIVVDGQTRLTDGGKVEFRSAAASGGAGGGRGGRAGRAGNGARVQDSGRTGGKPQ